MPGSLVLHTKEHYYICYSFDDPSHIYDDLPLMNPRKNSFHAPLDLTNQHKKCCTAASNPIIIYFFDTDYSFLSQLKIMMTIIHSR